MVTMPKSVIVDVRDLRTRSFLVDVAGESRSLKRCLESLARWYFALVLYFSGGKNAFAPEHINSFWHCYHASTPSLELAPAYLHPATMQASWL